MNNENSNMQVKKIAYRNWFGAYSKPRETLTFLTGKKQKDDTKEEINSNLRQAQGPLQRLRAMGIDSFMLYPRLIQLTKRQIGSLRGTTGILTMSENQRIYRNLQPARFEDGLAVPFNPQLSEASNWKSQLALLIRARNATKHRIKLILFTTCLSDAIQEQCALKFLCCNGFRCIQ